MGELALAVIALFSVMCGAVIGVLTWLASWNPPAAVLAGLTSTGACFMGTIQLISTIINSRRLRRDDYEEGEANRG